MLSLPYNIFLSGGQFHYAKAVPKITTEEYPTTPTMSSMCLAPVVHVALLPSSGMGHLTPSLRLAALFAQHHCHVTVITPQSTVSNAESQLLSKFLLAFPQVNHVQFHPPPSAVANPTNNSADAFSLQYEAIRRSSHLLLPLLTSISPPLSAFVYDVSLISPILPIANTLGVPHYTFFPTAATFLAFFSCFPTVTESLHKPDVVLEVPGISTMPRSAIPPMLLDPNNIMFKLFKEDSPKLTKLHGILVNTFDRLEAQTLEALRGGRVIKELPPIYSIGPLVPCEFEKEGQRGAPLKWLDDQPCGSVVYVSFGSKAVLGRDQIRELGDGLVRSGCTFLWVVKDKKVDRDDEEGLDGVLGIDLVEKTKEKGLVVKEWVDQREILDHKAVGGFLSHCGWNSVTEAAWFGVPILGWPQHGDQRINAEVVLKGGWGVWKKDWGWSGERLVKGEEIAEAVNELMNNESIVIKATEVKKAAREAMSVGGGSELILRTLVEEWKKKNGENI